ncbi:hypothetical protein ACFWVF_18290 [Streptomyces sp. NPDC058659]|uniref:hypothetical protein n=1 Tax=Streptomyces sp. NPDC058659 TaxID=3346581 RepID=UPI00365F103A
MPAERKDAFVLTQLLGLPYAEAAKAIGCPWARSAPAHPRPGLPDRAAPRRGGRDPGPVPTTRHIGRGGREPSRTPPRSTEA